MAPMRHVLGAAAIAALAWCGSGMAAPPDCADFSSNDRMDPSDRRWCQALAFKAKYMQGGKFVETAPSRRDGTVRDIRSRIVSSFSSGGSSSVEGPVTIAELKGFYRLILAGTSNTLYYGRQIRVSGTASTAEGTLEIYSPVDVDLWKLAAVLVENSDRNAPPPEDGLIMKGYMVTRIAPGAEQEFSAMLLPIGGDFMLLLNARDGPVRDIRLHLEEP